MCIRDSFKDSHIKLFKQPQTQAFKAVDFDINDFVGTNKDKSFMDDFIDDAEKKKRD